MSSGIAGGGLLDPDGAMEHLAAWKGRIDQMAMRTQAMSDRLQDLHVTVSDDNHLVEVTVDSTGGLVGLQFGARLHRATPEVLARTVMDTIAVAKAQIAQRTQDIVAETMGSDSSVGQAVVDRVARWSDTTAGADAARSRSGAGTDPSDEAAVDWSRWR